MQQPLIEYRDEFAGRETRVLETEGDGPPVLLLHGFADSADTWRLVFDRLSREGHRAMAIDLPGFGTCPGLAKDRSILDQIDDVVAAAVCRLADASGEAVVVAGNSLGGCASLRAAQNPDLPILSVAPVSPAGLEMSRWLSVIEREPLLRAYLSTQLPLPAPVAKAAVGQIYRTLAFADTRGVDPGMVRLFASHLSSRDSVARVMEIGRRLVGELRDPFDLETINAPVFLVWGDRDRLVAHKGASHLLEVLPQTRYDLISGCGHCPQIEAPDRVTHAIRGAITVASVTGRTKARRRSDYRSH